MGRKKATLIIAIIIGIANIFVSLGFGPMKGFQIPWLYYGSTEFYGLYDWLDCFSGYVLMPLGCILVCLFVSKIWGWKKYEAELTQDGRDGGITLWNKISAYVIIPLFMVIVIQDIKRGGATVVTPPVVFSLLTQLSCEPGCNACAVWRIWPPVSQSPAGRRQCRVLSFPGRPR